MWQPGQTLDDIEKETILKAYAFYRNNKTQTANSLGIAIRTLDAKLIKYGKIQAPHGDSIPARLSVESASETSAQRGVPVRERQEIQKVSPKPDAPRASKGRD